jgi:hypothetical protein
LTSSLAIQSFVAFCVSGIVGTENIITCKDQWPKEESLIPGQKKAVNTPLINPAKFYLLLLHIKFGTIKNFVNATDQNSAGFMHLKNKFPRKVILQSKKWYLLNSKVRVNSAHKI